jgi:hypothetical protein
MVGGTSILLWLGAAVCLALAFTVPLLAMLAAMHFSEIGRPTAAQLRAKRAALLAVRRQPCSLSSASFSKCYMIQCPTWLWVACWAIALALLLRSDNDAPAMLAPRSRVAHGVSELTIVIVFVLALHIADHLMFPAGEGTYDTGGIPPRLPHRRLQFLPPRDPPSAR